MKRSTSVTVAGALLIAGGIFVAFGALMGILGQLMIRSMPPLPNMPKTEIPLAATIFAFAWEALLAAWAIVTAIGIFRLRRWGWISMLALSGVMTVFAAFGVIAMAAAIPLMKAMPSTPGLPPNFETIIMLGVLGTLAVPLGCGIWWLILFSRKSVRIQFATATQDSVVQPEAHAGLAVAAMSEAPGRSARKIPVSILVIAIYLVAIGPLSLLSLAMPYMRRMPIMLFGQILWPGSGWIYLLAICALHLVLGIGLLMRNEWARWGTIAYCVFLLANSIVTVLRPHSWDRMMELMNRAIPELAQFYTAVPHLRFVYYFSMAFGLAVPIAALYFLWTRRVAYRAACAAKA